MAQMHNEQYERALKQLATSDSGSLMHYCFSVLQDSGREAGKQREMDAARQSMAQMHNEQYERALKQLATSDVGSLMHYCFSILQDEGGEARKQREMDAARQRMAQMHNEQYERALKQLATSDVGSLMHYCFSILRDEAREAR